MMTSQIFMFLESSKTQNCKYLEDEAFFLCQIQKFDWLYCKDYNMARNIFLAEATFNVNFKYIFKTLNSLLTFLLYLRMFCLTQENNDANIKNR